MLPLVYQKPEGRAVLRFAVLYQVLCATRFFQGRTFYKLTFKEMTIIELN